ncbi:MAG: ATP-binding protein [Dehalococcoidales bacterium]|jgi:two-component system OmpR family sensor kinase
MRSLSWKLAGALLLIVVISVGLTAYLINVNTTREFNQYVAQGNQKNILGAGAVLSQLYAEAGSWDDVQTWLPDFLRSPNDRLVVADASGIIVGDTDGAWLGSTASSAGLSGGTPITVSGRSAGTLYLAASQGGGQGYMGGGQGGGKGGPSATVAAAATGEQNFLDRFNHSLLITGLIVAAIALIIGLILTRQITRPLKALVNGVRQITRGNLAHRVNIKSHDELHDLGESFNTMAASLGRAEQERKRIIADIAHDLRTPLTVIEGTVTGIQDGVFQPDQERLETIKEQTSLLTRLTSDLRELSLVESGHLKLVLAPTDLADLARRKAAQFEVKAKEKGLEIKTDLPDNLPPVDIDPARIEQVLGNLVTNAIRHTSTGGITIALRRIERDAARRISRPGLVLSVADTGEGIAPEHLPHIFERFYRVEPSRQRGESGSGLGLAIVRQLVQAHGGQVWAESRPGQGSAFYVALPL